MREDIKISQKIRFEKACEAGRTQEVKQWLMEKSWNLEELNYGLFLACEKNHTEIIKELGMKMTWEEIHCLEDRCFFKAVASNAQQAALCLAADESWLEEGWKRYLQKNPDAATLNDWGREVKKTWSPWAGGMAAWASSVIFFLKKDFPVENIIHLSHDVQRARQSSWNLFFEKHRQEWERLWGEKEVAQWNQNMQTHWIEDGFWANPWHLNSHSLSKVVVALMKDVPLERGWAFLNDVFEDLDRMNAMDQKKSNRKNLKRDVESADNVRRRWQENLVGMQLISPQKPWRDWISKQPWTLQWDWDDPQWSMFNQHESKDWLEELRSRQRAQREKEQLEACLQEKTSVGGRQAKSRKNKEEQAEKEGAEKTTSLAKPSEQEIKKVKKL